MFIFDTDFIIDLTNSKEAAIKVARKIDTKPTYKAISVITVQEYLRGIWYLYSENPQKLATKLAQAEDDLSRFAILSVDYSIAKVAAEIDATLMKKGRMISSGDVIIAATAKRYGLTIVSRNVKHYSVIPDINLLEY